MKNFVTLEEIEEQRVLGWPNFHPEDYCHQCGHLNIKSWSVDSNLWNVVMKDSPESIICPSCFVARWEAMGGPLTTWKLVPEFL
jgi:hypothetical protein